MHQDELLDLLDENDVVIGTILRADYDVLIEKKLGYIRGTNIFIINDQGQLWIPKRTADKKIAPNGLDFSVGGHIDSGEDYLDAAIREAKEEINITISPADLVSIKKSRRDDVRYHTILYAYRYNETPQFNPEDFVSASWMTPQEVKAQILSGVPAKSDISDGVDALVSSEFYQQIIGS